MNKKDNLDEEIMNTAEETEETLEDIEDVTEEYVPKAETEAETDDNTEIAEKKDKKSDKEKKSGIVKEFFKSRKFRKGGLSIAFTALFVVVIISPITLFIAHNDRIVIQTFRDKALFLHIQK